MKLVTGNLWDYHNKPDTICCVTTNGTLKKNGDAVMGRGCAKEAATRYPSFPRRLGEFIKWNGTSTGYIHMPDLTKFFSFQVKYNWWEDADLGLIKKSTEYLDFAARHTDITYVLPRPGVGNGHRTWEEVEPIVKDLPNNVWIITF